MKKDIGKTFADSIRLICETNEGNMNTMLHPELIDFDLETETSTIRYQVKEWEKNQRGQVHGGAISAMFDVSQGMTIAVFKGRDVTTAEMSISYIRPFVGRSYDFKTELIHLGNKMARAECRAYDVDNGKLCATSYTTFAYIGQHVAD